MTLNCSAYKDRTSVKVHRIRAVYRSEVAFLFLQTFRFREVLVLGFKMSASKSRCAIAIDAPAQMVRNFWKTWQASFWSALISGLQKN